MVTLEADDGTVYIMRKSLHVADVQGYFVLREVLRPPLADCCSLVAMLTAAEEVQDTMLNRESSWIQCVSRMVTTLGSTFYLYGVSKAGLTRETFQ